MKSCFTPGNNILSNRALQDTLHKKGLFKLTFRIGKKIEKPGFSKESGRGRGVDHQVTQ